jgi:Zn-dependent protease with chaperone function
LTPEYWYLPPIAYAWQVTLHSLVAGSVFFAWARHHGLGSGRSKRTILCVLLVLPLVTAAIPGRGSDTFRDTEAWLDSARVLSLRVGLDLHVADLALIVGAAALLATFWQEVVPIFRPARADFTVLPDRLVRIAAAVPDVGRFRLGVLPDRRIMLATTGTPWAPRLLVSAGALEDLDDDELLATLLHERAHWNGRRWLATHALYAIRLFQCWNPAALWTFRTYGVEIEVACDAEAIAGHDGKPLIRALLKVYETLGRGDVAARRTLRLRIDELRGANGAHGNEVSVEAVLLATGVLAFLLPWLV